ncbi:MAG: hypothetical protein N4A57_01575 [Anaeromicrobium sp.]|jgi:hypothetical protein|uniref:hypothetical protein n=1 Tax=Anaeromicrobium sp. TaxID=1929132 RepID=UPI0025F0D407|nr:hypothetical protein [Anaeromicrobium sp.]MCT4592956.1 hypothetical protein [Anaeromicrobium sp.]
MDFYTESLLDIPEEISEVPFTRMEERIKDELKEDFMKLKERVGEEYFEKYFNSLIRINKHEKDLLIITSRESHRSIIMREFFDHIKEVFNVNNIIIAKQ